VAQQAGAATKGRTGQLIVVVQYKTKQGYHQTMYTMANHAPAPSYPSIAANAGGNTQTVAATAAGISPAHSAQLHPPVICSQALPAIGSTIMPRNAWLSPVFVLNSSIELHKYLQAQQAAATRSMYMFSICSGSLDCQRQNAALCYSYSLRDQMQRNKCGCICCSLQCCAGRCRCMDATHSEQMPRAQSASVLVARHSQATAKA
jgi:hypothetical protein